MAVDFLLILLLQTEQNLRWYNALVRIPKVEILVQSEGCCVLKQMCCHRFICDCVLHVIILLVDAQCRQTAKYTRMDLLASIRNDAYHDLLPSILTPCLRILSCAQMRNISHTAM